MFCHHIPSLLNIYYTTYLLLSQIKRNLTPIRFLFCFLKGGVLYVSHPNPCLLCPP
nr:MAG TPA: hypothetical protein [Caudoviricetes sp.]